MRPTAKSAKEYLASSPLVAELMKDSYGSLEFERRANKLFYPGSYDPALMLMTLDSSLPEEDLALVYLHEHAHFVLGQRHWGEAIRRLNTLSIGLTRPADLRRGQHIVRLLKGGATRELALDELMQISYSAKLRRKIRKVLSKDRHFLDALRIVDQCERKRSILASQWVAIQEGFAYWACVRLGRELCETAGFKDGLRKVEVLASNLTSSLPPNIIEAYQTVSGISAALDYDFTSTFGIIATCLDASFEAIPILQSSDEELKQHVSDPSHSPDKRLLEAHRLILSGDYNPRTSPLGELHIKLDPISQEPHMTIDSFNEYWHKNVDMAPIVVQTMNALYEDIGVNLKYEFEPIPKGEGQSGLSNLKPIIQFSDSPPEPPEFFPWEHTERDIKVENGQPTSEAILEDYQQWALQRDGLMRMARAEGLIK